jgi:hypothetical protein
MRERQFKKSCDVQEVAGKRPKVFGTEQPEYGNGGLSQHSLLRFQILLDGFDAIAGMGDADGVGLAQFVMHEQFPNHDHQKIRFRHAPELTGFQGWLANAPGRLYFFHVPSCAMISIKPVKSPAIAIRSKCRGGHWLAFASVRWIPLVR